MNSYKVKGIILAVIISLASIMMPFSVYADTLTNSNITYNYYLTDVVDSTSQLANKNYIYDVDFLFDKSYLGWVSVSMITSYIFDTGDTRQATYTKAIYVNGNTAKTSIVISSNFTGANGSPLSSMSITINNSNVTPLADLSSLQDIIDLLQDINEHIAIDVMDELENIVSNTSLANQYLNVISKIKQWNVPLESLPFTFSILTYESNKIIESINYYYSEYPIISLVTRNYLYAVWSQQTTGQYYLIFGTDTLSNNISRFQQNFEITNANILSVNPIYNSYYRYDFYVVKFERNGAGYCYFRNIVNLNFIPVYMGSVDNKNVSTEFALRWGLSNQLLDDLHIIANGSSSSNSAASDLESEASEYSEIADDVIGVEEGLTSNFETSVNQIDLNTGLNGFGGNFMTSATWVRTQFDRLTENTPYGSLVVYGLTLGFVLLMLGKVLL